MHPSLSGFAKSATIVYIYQLILSFPYRRSSLPPSRLLTLAMPISQHQSCLYSCLALSRRHVTAPMPVLRHKVNTAKKWDVAKTSRYSGDAKKHSRLQCLKSYPAREHNPASCSGYATSGLNQPSTRAR